MALKAEIHRLVLPVPEAIIPRQTLARLLLTLVVRVELLLMLTIVLVVLAGVLVVRTVWARLGEVRVATPVVLAAEVAPVAVALELKAVLFHHLMEVMGAIIPTVLAVVLVAFSVRRMVNQELQHHPMAEQAEAEDHLEQAAMRVVVMGQRERNGERILVPEAVAADPAGLIVNLPILVMVDCMVVPAAVKRSEVEVHRL